tara:strand:+ start:6806 stop:7087 length:282 start_codon:yes stop_codon:yes gene_type:complete
MDSSYLSPTFYFNNILTIDIKNHEYDILNNLNWETKKIVLNNQFYILDYLYNNNNHYLKSNNYYSSNQFHKLFNITYFKWYFKGKIIKLVEYN